MKDLERIIRFYPAYDKRHPAPSKNYGIHGVNLLFVLKGKEGAVQFLIFTNWHLSHVQKELDAKLDSQFPHLSCHPLPADLGYHSPKPTYDGQTVCFDSCEWLDGQPCYYDGSGLAAEKIYNILVEKGDEAVWKELEKYYSKTFEGSGEA